jgi:hypothetical protein
MTTPAAHHLVEPGASACVNVPRPLTTTTVLLTALTLSAVATTGHQRLTDKAYANFSS